ncbi:MAG: YfhO family protein [Anaerolineae bacterium]|nr:YfhO family protein [Anaerolineae bacterium]
MHESAENSKGRTDKTLRISLKSAWPDILALVFLLLLVLIFFWPVTLDLGWIPYGGGDLTSMLWPNYSYAAQSLNSGRIPLWNPTLKGGEPFIADSETGLLYPINLITFFLLPSLPYEAVEWLVLVHIWLAGASMYWLMRVLLPRPVTQDQVTANSQSPYLSHLASLFSGTAFMFSGVFITHIGNLNLNAVSAWLPAVFAALHLALTRRSFGWAAGAGVLLSFSALAGHAQMSIIIGFALGLYTVWYIAWAGEDRLRLLALAGLTPVVAFGLSAVAFFPAVEILPMTSRANLDYNAATAFSIPWAGLGGLFSPLVFGRGPKGFWGPWNRIELGYLGVLPLFFAGLAPFKKWRSMPTFMAALGFLGLLIALGNNAPLHRLLYLTVPGFSGMRVPARFILLTDFSLAILAGFGLCNLFAISRKRLFTWGAVLLFVSLVAILFGYHHAITVTGTRHDSALRAGLAVSTGLLLLGMLLAFQASKNKILAPTLALVILAGDMIGHGAWIEVEYTDPTTGFQHPSAVEYLQAQPGLFRIDNASTVWAPSASANFGLENIGGTRHALEVAAYQTYLDSLGWRGSPVYNFLNVQFVIADKSQPPADATFVPVFNEDPAVDVYLNTNAMPRINLVYSATRVSTGEEAFTAIHAPDFDPQRQVVIEDIHAPAGTNEPPSDPSNLYYTHYEPEASTVIVQTPAPAYLVFSEVWHPGWHAWVDNVQVPIYRANFVFRAVYLESAGEHTVDMRFEPLSWKIGVTLTAVTLLALFGWALFPVSRRLVQRLRNNNGDDTTGRGE